jgi:hypothetical protein
MTVSSTELIPHMVRAIQELAMGQGQEQDHALLKADHASLKEDHALLKADHASLKEDHALLKADHASLKAKVGMIAEWLRNTQGVVFA